MKRMFICTLSIFLLLTVIFSSSACSEKVKYNANNPFVVENARIPEMFYDTPVNEGIVGYGLDAPLSVEGRIEQYKSEAENGCSILLVKKTSSKSYYCEDKQGNIEFIYTDTVMEILGAVDGDGEKHLTYTSGGEIHLLEMFALDPELELYIGVSQYPFGRFIIYTYEAGAQNLPIISGYTNKYKDLLSDTQNTENIKKDTVAPFLRFDSTYLLFIDERWCLDDELSVNYIPHNKGQGMYVKYQAFELSENAYKNAVRLLDSGYYEGEYLYKDPYGDYIYTVKQAYEYFMLNMA